MYYLFVWPVGYFLLKLKADIRIMDATKVILNRIFAGGIKLHLFFISTLMLLTATITLQSRLYKAVAPRAVFVYLLLICSIYTGRWLSKQFLVMNRWLQLILFCSLTISLLSAVGVLGLYHLLGYKDGADLSGIVVITPLLVTTAVFAGGMVSVVRIVWRQQVKESLILRQQKEMEITQLTARLSPHFLFNTLNNLYGLSINEHQRVPDLLLRLSGLLRYHVYSTNQPFVLLNNELTYLQDFIALEQIRMKDRLTLNLELTNTHAQLKIAPLLLMSFVENAFKHAKQSLEDAIGIEIKLSTTPEYIYLKVCNTCADEMVTLKGIEGQSGFGLRSTILRLDLLYPNAYNLTYGEVNKRYEVNLKLESRV